MKGDFTRTTFDAKRHFSSVRMQQGRVQLDADWNEQLDISAHRVEIEARDLIGRCGGPLHDAGLAIAAAVGDLPPAQQAAAGALTLRPGDLFISAGRYYVDGILCENDQPVLATGQPDLPVDAEIVRVGDNLTKLVPPPQAGVYLVYADVWSRHLTAIEAPHILETALGGPDTCTRTKTVWQVKLLRAGNVGADINCATEVLAWGQVTAKPTGKLSARAEPGAVSTDPCIVAPGAGYRRLENQLYRVEVHKSGTLGNATFKWSRDNGSILTTWESKAGNDLTVGSIGRDQPLGFAAGQWIELTDDDRDQRGEAGTLVRLVKAEGKVLTIDPASAGTDPVDRALFKTNPKIRRWDSAGPVDIQVPGGNQGFVPLEGGVEVKFSAGSYRTGDYWLIPARTATGDVEWPKDPTNNNAPIPQPPHGIEHHYCRLAVAEFNAGQWTIKSDCRELFPPATELTSLHYVGGDGQEMAPDPSATQWLCGPLQVRVLNGGTPVAGAKVVFQVFEPHPAGSAKLATLDQAQQGTQLTVVTDDSGLAACRWRLDASAANVCQMVSATLLNRAGLPTLHQQVIFTGRLIVFALGEPDLTRIVATSWRHGQYEADLFPIFESVVGGQDRLVGVGFVIAFSNGVIVPRGVNDHVLEVLIPEPRIGTVTTGGGGMPFTLLDMSPQSVYQCWCPLLTGHDAQGRMLGRIVPVTCEVQGTSITKAKISSEAMANGVAFLLDSNSITHLLIHQTPLFEQFWVRLRCDFVLDQEQRAVDGEFLRAHLPSGDRPIDGQLGIQGGLFESWFSFRGNFRGGHMLPTVHENQLRVDVVSFWRKKKPAIPVLFASINGGPPQFLEPFLVEDDLTNLDFDVRLTRHTLNLTPGTEQVIDVRWDGASRVSHVPNVNLGSFSLRSRMVWDGRPSLVRIPIVLNLRTVNRNVIRGQGYEARLAASSPDGLRLTYDQALSENIAVQPPGLRIDPQTGLMSIDAGNTPKYKDNQRNPGADFAFSGTVFASNGSFVMFEGMFDGIEIP